MRSASLTDLTIRDGHGHFFPLGYLGSLYLLTGLSIMLEVFFSSFLKIPSSDEHLPTYSFAILLKIQCVLFYTGLMLLLDVDQGTGLFLATGQVAFLEKGSHVDLRDSVLRLPLLTADLPLGKQFTSLPAMCSIQTPLCLTISDYFLTGIPPIQNKSQLRQSRSFVPPRLLEERVPLLSGMMRGVVSRRSKSIPILIQQVITFHRQTSIEWMFGDFKVLQFLLEGDNLLQRILGSRSRVETTQVELLERTAALFLHFRIKIINQPQLIIHHHFSRLARDCLGRCSGLKLRYCRAARSESRYRCGWDEIMI